MKHRSRSPICTLVQLHWPHAGSLCRVGPWPEVEFERRIRDVWLAYDPDEDAIAAAAAAITPDAWKEYLDYVPPAERELLGRFRVGRIAALQVLARCPGLIPDLIETPALVSFLAAHRSLRGGASARWAEINAVHERAGLFGLLEWLGLPASRQTLAVLRRIANPDLPVRFLEPLRTSLWEPESLWDLQHRGSLTVRFLQRFCHPLAA